jgi:hypothetical protein
MKVKKVTQLEEKHLQCDITTPTENFFVFNNGIGYLIHNSPAIIFGRNEDGEFILTDKSGFSAKGYDGKAKSPRELKNMFLNRSGGKNRENPEYVEFTNKMAGIFGAYEKAVPQDHRGFFKGDLLYFNTPVAEGGDYVFKPNIVEYRVDQDSDLGKKIGKSQSGIVIHREVDSEGNEGPLQNKDIFQGDEVLVVPPVTASSAPEINDASIQELKASISKNAAAMDSLLDPNSLAQMQLKKLPDVFYAYLNSKVDTGLENLGDDFLEWVSARNQLSDSAKKKIAEYVSNNAQGFAAVWEVVAKIQDVKDDVIDQLDKQDIPVKQSMSSGDDTAQGGEGYVMAHPEGDIKLVPRKTFSKYNRAVKR